jgi:HlyD family secretion protein
MGRAVTRRIAAAVVAALAVVLVCGAWRLTGRRAAGPGRAVARRADIVTTVEITGTLRALDSDQAGPPVLPDFWEYRLVKMAPEGAAMKKGQMVLQFDTTELAQKLEEKRSERDSAAKQLEKRGLELAVREEALLLQEAEAEARRRKTELKVEVPVELVGANELAQSRLDLDLSKRELAWIVQRKGAARRAADAERASLRERRESAGARVREIEDRIRQMTVLSPRDGTLVYLTNWRDEKKKVGDVCWRGERVVEVPDLGRMIVKGEVDEADSAALAEGQGVSLRLEAHPDATFAGHIISVGRTVQLQSPKIPKKVVKVDVALEASDPLRMRPGMRVRGGIETGRFGGLLVLPLEAVFPSPSGPVAWRTAWGGPVALPLVLGKRNEKLVEVVKGIGEGVAVLAQAQEAAGRRAGSL